MSITVDKINNVQFTGNRRNRSKNVNDNPIDRDLPARRDNYDSVSNSQMRNATKALIALMIGGATLSGTASCADAYAEVDEDLEQLLNKKDSCCCCCHPHIIHTTDTIHDTIPGEPQIIEHYDTIRLKPDFKSPVIDSLNTILHDLGNDTTGGYIPLRIAFIDEMDTKYKNHVFDGEASAPANIFYSAKHSPWSDAENKFIIGTPLDESVKYMLSLTGDGKLYVNKMVPKNGVTDPRGLDDYMLAFDSYVFDRDQAKKLIKKFNVARDEVGRNYAGTLERTSSPKTIKLTNPYGTEWRWTNLNVIRGDAPSQDDKRY